MTDEEQGDIQAAIEAGKEHVWVRPADGLEQVMLFARPDTHSVDTIDLEEFLPHPRRMAGTVQVVDHESFVAYVNEHKALSGTTIYAHEDGSMVAVLNDHNGIEDVPGWRDHRVAWKRPLMRAFKDWMAIEGKPLGQYDFANFLEDHLTEIVEPAGADLLEMAQKFRASKSISFRTQTLLKNGEVQVEYVEHLDGGTDAAASTPTAQRMTVPDQFRVLLQPYRDVDPFLIEARLRWTLREQSVHFTFRFPELQDRLDDINHAEADKVREATEVLVLRGVE